MQLESIARQMDRSALDLKILACPQVLLMAPMMKQITGYSHACKDGRRAESLSESSENEAIPFGLCRRPSHMAYLYTYFSL